MADDEKRLEEGTLKDRGISRDLSDNDIESHGECYFTTSMPYIQEPSIFHFFLTFLHLFVYVTSLKFLWILLFESIENLYFEPIILH